MQCEADLDASRRYRYALRRYWGQGQQVAFVLLNPSTADESTDDPTLRRCLAFARKWGFGRLEIANCFAWRSADPKALRSADDPVGGENDASLKAVAERSDRIVIGWGNGGLWRGRDRAVCRLLDRWDLWCLGTTGQNAPRHPLYVPSDTPLVRYHEPPRDQ